MARQVDVVLDREGNAVERQAVGGAAPLELGGARLELGARQRDGSRPCRRRARAMRSRTRDELRGRSWPRSAASVSVKRLPDRAESAACSIGGSDTSSIQMSAVGTIRMAAHQVVPNLYRDSVSLMQLSATLGALPGVEQASAVMATPANLALLREAGLLRRRAIAAGPNDLLVAVRGKSAARA